MHAPGSTALPMPGTTRRNGTPPLATNPDPPEHHHQPAVPSALSLRTPSSHRLRYLAPAAPSPFLLPVLRGETRPRYPGGWGSGVGSHRTHTATLAITERRGGRGQAVRALASVRLPRSLQQRMPRRLPRLTSTRRGTRRGTLCGTRRGSRVHVDAGQFHAQASGSQRRTRVSPRTGSRKVFAAIVTPSRVRQGN